MNFDKLIEIKLKKIDYRTIINYPEVWDLCKRPYPKHRKGCPNYCKGMLCPPNSIKFSEMPIYRHYYLVYVEFNFALYRVLRMMEWDKKDFKYTQNQVKCVLYWQGAVKKIIKDYLEQLIKSNRHKYYLIGCGSGLKISYQPQVYSMEAMQINVFSTMKLNGIKYEIRPKNIIVLCNLICSTEPMNF